MTAETLRDTVPETLPATLLDKLTGGPGRGVVVVGIDDTDAAANAVTWATREAHSREVSLVLVRAYVWQVGEPWFPRDDQDILKRMETRARLGADRELQRVRELDPQLTAAAEAVEGYPPKVLIDAGRHAGLIVVGRVHHTVLGDALLGSVSSPVAAQAPCAVVVVSGAVAPGEHTSVVAGVSPGPESSEVLAFAFDHAARHGLLLRPILCSGADDVVEGEQGGGSAAPRSAAVWLDEALARWRQRYPGVEVRPTVSRDHPAAGLNKAVGQGDLLVVGRHRHRPRYGSWLGSVSHALVHHAPCTVAVVPPRPEA